MHFIRLFGLVLLLLPQLLASEVIQGIDVLLENGLTKLKGKRVGLVTNNSAVNGQLKTTISLLKTKAKTHNYTIAALFAPEHGIKASARASAWLVDEKDEDGIPIYSLHGEHRKPTAKMLRDIDLLVFDLQDVGVRTYTYSRTLFGVMEAAAESKVPLIVLDRPNPINGVVVDGPMLEEKWKSNIGYINIPYCHGMTMGELALLYNREYNVNSQLEVIAMKGWDRKMTFKDTGLAWIPTSPYIPESSTPLYYPMTGILGDMHFVNIGIGYTLPFKLVGAPWIQAEKLAAKMQEQNLPGVAFHPFYFEPFYGKMNNEPCQGILLVVTDHLKFKPVTTQYALIGILKSMYPEPFKEAISAVKEKKDLFCKINGSEKAFKLVTEENNIAWKLRGLDQKERENFLPIRKKYLISAYGKD